MLLENSSFNLKNIQAPCEDCIKLWISSVEDYKNMGNVVLEPSPCNKNKYRELEVSFSNEGVEYKGIYFPHPECTSHLISLQKYSLDIMESGIWSPIKKIIKKEDCDDGVYIYIALIDSPSNVKFPYLVGRGIDNDESLSHIKAVAEALERYSACLPPRTRLHYGKANEFENVIVNCIKNYTKDIWWCEGEDLLTKQLKYLPIEYVQLESLSTVKDPIFNSDSTGMAIHPNYKDAINIGLSEVLERKDLYEIVTQSFSPVLWDNSSLPEEAKRFITLFENRGYNTLIIPHSSVKGFTSCIILLVKQHKTNNGPALICGAGGAWLKKESLLKGLMEAYAQLIHGLEVGELDRQIREYNFSDPYHHFLYYFNSENANNLLENWGIYQSLHVDFKEYSDFKTSLEAKAKVIEKELVVVDRGNILTDFLNLSAIQIVAPEIPRISPTTLGPGNMPHPFS
ncbi:YcaO-like family protein [Bacillus paranthracis]|uniref:YcaO-like family protein n=1 Tax=Bacillus paranthracis TaxID=2026186 RepID=UPI0018CF3733|nr:YcaO-like family protein [Bacillus paranthracis]MBG9906381.1 hypothetical protein [Bacillus paranthracis]